jgi:hypothetical protein
VRRYNVDGIGKPHDAFARRKSGLDTGIVKALLHQLDAEFTTVAGA